jgi:hypothetical protein
MGFAKASDLKRLEREVMELKSLIKGKATSAKKKPVAKKKASVTKTKSAKAVNKKGK